MGKTKKVTEKFQFGLDFQEAILQYTVSDPRGYKALGLYEDSYFSLLSHSFIAMGLHKYFKTKKRIPGKVILREYLRNLYTHREYAKHMTEQLVKEINQVVDQIYLGVPKDGDDILDNIVKFAQYTELKAEVENMDLNDFAQYSSIEGRIRKAISTGRTLDKSKGVRLVADAERRTQERDNEPNGKATPFWQWNRSLNGGTLKKGALVMFMGKAKRFKTGALINVALKLLNRKKVVLYIDLENGEKNLGNRADQSMGKSRQEQLVHEDMIKKLLKQYRKYKRLGSELIIIRKPALTTTMRDVQGIIQDLRLEEGLIVTDCIIDYGDLLGAMSGNKDEIGRISDAYLDMKNVAEEENLDAIYTASHVKGDKDTVKREATKYQAEDVAKCKEKIRHLDICWGLQQTPEEKAAHVMRWEIIEQRDGPGDFTAYFWVDIPTQRMTEFTKEQVKEHQEQMGERTSEDAEENKKVRKSKVTDL